MLEYGEASTITVCCDKLSAACDNQFYCYNPASSKLRPQLYIALHQYSDGMNKSDELFNLF